MVIGCIETPNKWASFAKIKDSPVIYINSIRYPGMSNCETWGGVIQVDPWFRTFKVITQIGYRVTEYWCVMLDDTEAHRGVLVPIAMKRFGYHNVLAKCFVFQASIATLLQATNTHIPNYNHMNDMKYSCGEYVLMGLEENEMWPDWSEMWRKEVSAGKDLVRFPSGSYIHLSEVLHRCAMIESFAKSTIQTADNMSSPHDFGLNNGMDAINYMADYTPIDPSTGILELDQVGECIVKNQITTFNIRDMDAITLHTPATINTMNMLQAASQQEELIAVENIQNACLSDLYCNSSMCDDIQENIDDIITCFCMDEATTIAVEYDYSTNKCQTLERIYAYGECSAANYRGPRGITPEDQILFSLNALCEALTASKIRCIKTYNEELFVTVFYTDGRTASYYFNIIVHACVSGVLFSW